MQALAVLRTVREDPGPDGRSTANPAFTPGNMRSGESRIGLGLLLLALVSSPVAGAEAQVVQRQAFLMGTQVRVEVRATDRTAGLRASERILAALRQAESRLSTWRDDTELAHLNRAPVGAPVGLSRSLYRELNRAWDCARSTNGRFDPAIGPLVTAWGLRAGGRMPSADERERARAFSAPGAFRLDADGTAVRLRDGARIEEGGFGKGAALDDALRSIQSEAGVDGALVDLGGQVSVWSRGEPWAIELAHPARRLSAVARLELESGSISTSGNSERGLEIDGTHYAHVLDPRTGAPVADFGSLVVLARDGLSADCLSTGLYVMGPKAALHWALAHPGVDVAVLEPRGDGVHIRATPGLADRLRLAAVDASLHRVSELSQLPSDIRGASHDSAAGRSADRVH